MIDFLSVVVIFCSLLWCSGGCWGFTTVLIGAVQLLRNSLGGGGRPGVTLCDRGRGGGGSAERYVTPKILYIVYNIYYNF